MVKRTIFFYALVSSMAFLPPNSWEAVARSPSPSSTERVPIREVVQQIEGLLKEALIQYHQGHPQRAKTMVSGAYFDLFEGRGLEALLATESPALKVELESIFGRIIGLMRAGAEAERVRQEVKRLVTYPPQNQAPSAQASHPSRDQEMSEPPVPRRKYAPAFRGLRSEQPQASKEGTCTC